MELQINCVRINRSRPVTLNLYRTLKISIFIERCETFVTVCAIIVDVFLQVISVFLADNSISFFKNN